MRFVLLALFIITSSLCSQTKAKVMPTNKILTKDSLKIPKNNKTLKTKLSYSAKDSIIYTNFNISYT